MFLQRFSNFWFPNFPNTGRINSFVAITKETINERLFRTMLVFRKGTVTLVKLFLELIRTCETCSKTSHILWGHAWLTYLKTVTFKPFSEAATGGVLKEKVFWEISQNLQ